MLCFVVLFCCVGLSFVLFWLLLFFCGFRFVDWGVVGDGGWFDLIFYLSFIIFVGITRLVGLVGCGVVFVVLIWIFVLLCLLLLSCFGLVGLGLVGCFGVGWLVVWFVWVGWVCCVDGCYLWWFVSWCVCLGWLFGVVLYLGIVVLVLRYSGFGLVWVWRWVVVLCGVVV